MVVARIEPTVICDEVASIDEPLNHKSDEERREALVPPFAMPTIPVKVESDKQFVPIAKHPPESEIPTFDVEVAEPLTVKPETVVVPKPVASTVKNLVVSDEEATWKSGIL